MAYRDALCSDGLFLCIHQPRDAHASRLLRLRSAAAAVTLKKGGGVLNMHTEVVKL